MQCLAPSNNCTSSEPCILWTKFTPCTCQPIQKITSHAHLQNAYHQAIIAHLLNHAYFGQNSPHVPVNLSKKLQAMHISKWLAPSNNCTSSDPCILWTKFTPCTCQPIQKITSHAHLQMLITKQ